MKKITLSFSVLAVLLLTLQSCVKDECEQLTTYYEHTPIYKSVEEIRAITVTNEPAKPLKNPGKIYFYQDFIFINEVREGVHVIDNTNPENPVNVTFIALEGNVDIAIRNGNLYADAYTDLLTIDLANIFNVAVVDRDEDVFPHISENAQGQRLVGYIVEKRTETLNCETRDAVLRGGGIWQGGMWLANVDAEASFNLDTGSGSNGTGGSMARFTLVNDYLYTVDNHNLNTFSVANAANPTFSETVNVGWGIETIYPHQDKLFIGSNRGMYIFDNSNPASPAYVSELAHWRACDPVFVKDNYAYVTLRDGSLCQGFNNQLDLIDISDIYNPELIESFPMKNPHGLSIDGDNLFLCEGEYGLKVFDISDPEKLDHNRIEYLKKIFAYDVIAMPGESDVLLMIGEDGFYQYDYSNPAKLKELSRIEVEK